MNKIIFLICTIVIIINTGCSDTMWTAQHDDEIIIIPGGDSGNNGSQIEIIITGPSDFDYSVNINDLTTKQPAAGWIQSMRAVALSPDRTLIYTAFLLGNPADERYLLAYNTSDGTLARSATYGIQPRYCKGVAVHSSGRVYYTFGNSDEIGLCNSDLTGLTPYAVETAVGIPDLGDNDFDPQGLEVYGNYLYVSSDRLRRVYRFNLDPVTGNVLGHDAAWASGNGYVELKGTDIELTGLNIYPGDGSIWVPSEDEDLVYRIESDGSSFTSPITTPVKSQPHDVDFLGDYILITYGADDGKGSSPHGVGVYRMDNYQEVTTLLDSNQELRNAQGIEVDDTNRLVYVVDGYFGAPNDFSVENPTYSNPGPPAEDEADLIMVLRYNK